MQKFMAKLLAGILFFYDKNKRKVFRARFSQTAVWTRKLRKAGIIGSNTYINHTSSILDKRTRIGKFCSIGPHVFIGTLSHPTHFLSTSPFPYKDITPITDGLVFPKERQVDFTSQKPVTIGNDVWIGVNAVILDGLTIGDGAIIGAGAIVTRDVPPYAIALGVPARVVKYRFDERTIERLLKAKWWDRPDEEIASLPANDVEKSLEILENMPDSKESA